MKDIISISNPLKKTSGTIELPGSKSESNRVLIINALTGNKCCLHNLSSSNDTMILQEALASDEVEINIGDAGTALRFLIPYFAVIGQDKLLTGSERMLERPVGPLIDALKALGADISYSNKHGFPPVMVKGSLSFMNSNRIKIAGNISSQFISALLMIAPTLPYGLEVEIDGKVSSKPYIEMTLQIMRHFGVKSNWEENIISVGRQDYIPVDYTIESDWSCASTWYATAASTDNPAIFLKGLKRKSNQGDSISQGLFSPFGIITEFTDTGVFVTKGDADFSKLPKIVDFTNHPDLAQTFIVLCAANSVECKFTGLDSLRIKETDRILALQNELEKFNIRLVEDQLGIFSLNGKFNINASPLIETYDDHRMAMAFVTLSFFCKEIKIRNPSCVKKSYPSFWDDCKACGFEVLYESF